MKRLESGYSLTNREEHTIVETGSRDRSQITAEEGGMNRGNS